MGLIKRVLRNKEVPTPKLNNRLTVELCENVHLHYRNIRLEFKKDEFLTILRLLKRLDEKRIEDYQYGKEKFDYILVENKALPDEAEFDKRLQIEEQAEGHYHVHYRNLRIEVDDLGELGY
jgi:hypothetical protein